jgi:hypothetical protein
MKEGTKTFPKPGNFEVITFDKQIEQMKKHDNHEIIFELKRGSGANIAFPKNLVNVMWAKKVQTVNDPCPTSASHLPGEFFAVDVNDDQDELTIINTNMVRGEFIAFRINFVPKGVDDVLAGQPYPYSYDPIGGNQNGQYPLIVPEAKTLKGKAAKSRPKAVKRGEKG